MQSRPNRTMQSPQSQVSQLRCALKRNCTQCSQQEVPAKRRTSDLLRERSPVPLRLRIWHCREIRKNGLSCSKLLILKLDGGRGGIRTPIPFRVRQFFKTGAINHSATLPSQIINHRPKPPPRHRPSYKVPWRPSENCREAQDTSSSLEHSVTAHSRQITRSDHPLYNRLTSGRVPSMAVSASRRKIAIGILSVIVLILLAAFTALNAFSLKFLSPATTGRSSSSQAFPPSPFSFSSPFSSCSSATSSSSTPTSAPTSWAPAFAPACFGERSWSRSSRSSSCSSSPTA